MPEYTKVIGALNYTYSIDRGVLKNGDTAKSSYFRMHALVDTRPYGAIAGSGGYAAYADEPCRQAGWRGVEAEMVSFNFISASQIFDSIQPGSNINHLFAFKSSYHEEIDSIPFETFTSSDLHISEIWIQSFQRGLLPNPDHPVTFNEFRFNFRPQRGEVIRLEFYTVVEMSGDWGSFTSDTLSYYLIH
ncbi:hypothetical protein [Phaeocystidibacter luteus]|uniref:Uncharacterized protein n=1 Tax=Phaeocystidibacter luteus TaxID=911197 RepID=A0A6N6RIQ7_9FLAO|nr:hypothetical protein [Phaeocystidibacter luteus]KAB2814220.1 hypothetical protein F8C67_00385 [Phaeocystidibacter luteus]